jgi:cyanophycinase
MTRAILRGNAMHKSATFAAVCSLAFALTSIVAIAAQPAAGPVAPAPFNAPFKAESYGTGAVKVGPPNGTVIAVGGGAQGPEIYKAFIDAAGGPGALILDVPNNSIPERTSTAPAWVGQGLRKNGARNVHVLFTQSRAVADSDAFVAIIKKAKGIWFDGGRQYLDVAAYGGTRSERAFRGVLQRGGVIGGSSAGMAVLGDFLVRGAPSNNNYIEDYPGHEKGFGYLRDTATDMHVVARERLPDLTAVIARYPGVLGISADEGTAWVVHGDVAHIIGRDKAFVYTATGPRDKGVPYLTLYPGDVYDLYTRRVVSRAADKSPVTRGFITSLFKKYDAPLLGGATVLVAQDGAVLVDRAFGILPQDRYMPRTTLPQFPIGDIGKVFTSLCAQVPEKAPARSGPGGPVRPAYYSSALEKCVARLSMPIGMHRTTVPPGSEEIVSDVDELYRLDLGLEYQATWPKADHSRGWTADTFDGVQRLAAYGTKDGRRAAFIRIPSHHATVIILTNDPNADARGMAQRITSRLLNASR